MTVECYRCAKKVIDKTEYRNDSPVDYSRLNNLIPIIKGKVKDLIVHMLLYKHSC